MKFSLFKPSNAFTSSPPCLYYLSGLTCSDEQFVTKASSAFAYAQSENISICIPDTSPRFNPVDGDSTSWDFGIGAGFYIDASVDPWKAAGYKMETYLTEELTNLIASEQFNCGVKARGVFGHSMGGRK